MNSATCPPIPIGDPWRGDSRNYRIIYLVGFFIYGLSLLRGVQFWLEEPFGAPFNLTLGISSYSAFLLLYLVEPLISRRFKHFIHVYFILQVLLVQILGLLHVGEDTWCMLYFILAFQARYHYPPRLTYVWWGIFSASAVLTLISDLGWLAGLGRGLFFIAVPSFLLIFDIIYTQAEAARRESHQLLAQLREAHQQLQQSAAQVEELVSTQERNRMANELHDSVGQLLFSISLTAQSARLLLDKDPQRLPALLEQLQEMTAKALAQMRSLISQWRKT